MNRNDHKHKALLENLQSNRRSLEAQIGMMYDGRADGVKRLKILGLLQAYESQTSIDTLFGLLCPSPDYLRDLYYVIRVQHNKFHAFEYMSNTTLKRWMYRNKAFNHFITFASKHLKLSLVDTFKFLCLINK